ncbi:hypothetical protein LY90DRAFT_213699 [Neocallimastix californiae]|uniref:Uncharacterized protein n=1 Tax=Neocallimastix californiae TaxID=1754190 RepID=A0A1Y2EBD9_9FUNG|nr:hypothetical protein LY90DRAFT_213699 [Neocallimastix californiae]|eukprot:ORY68155.1 hypothetical protein LY90DRAFT_213699 [Neocallimastix californiae]
MSSKTSNDVEEDLNDPAWKPLKSKRQMFESAQNSPNPISNTEGRKTHTSRVSNTKRFQIKSGIVEQRKIAVTETKEITIDPSKKAEPNIEAYSASSEAKHLKQLLELNTSTVSPGIKKTNKSHKRDSYLLSSRSKEFNNKNSYENCSSQEELDSLSSVCQEIDSLNSLCHEIEKAISLDTLNDEPSNTKPSSKVKSNISSKINSAVSSPIFTNKKGQYVPPPPASSRSSICSIPSTPNMTNSSKLNKGVTPLSFKNYMVDSSSPEPSARSGTPKLSPKKKFGTTQSPVRSNNSSTVNSPQIKGSNNSSLPLNSIALPPSVKKYMPSPTSSVIKSNTAPSTPVTNNTTAPPTPVKKLSTAPPTPVKPKKINNITGPPTPVKPTKRNSTTGPPTPMKPKKTIVETVSDFQVSTPSPLSASSPLSAVSMPVPQEENSSPTSLAMQKKAQINKKKKSLPPLPSNASPVPYTPIYNNELNSINEGQSDPNMRVSPNNNYGNYPIQSQRRKSTQRQNSNNGYNNNYNTSNYYNNNNYNSNNYNNNYNNNGYYNNNFNNNNYNNNYNNNGYYNNNNFNNNGYNNNNGYYNNSNNFNNNNYYNNNGYYNNNSFNNSNNYYNNAGYYNNNGFNNGSPTNLPSFLRLPSGSPQQQFFSPGGNNVPGFVDLVNANLINQFPSPEIGNENYDRQPSPHLRPESRSGNRHRDHSISMYNASTKPNNGVSRYSNHHTRSRSTTYSRGNNQNNIPGSFSAFCDPNDPNISYIQEESRYNGNNQKEKESPRKMSNSSKSGNRGFFINRNDKKSHPQRITYDNSAMNLFFMGQSPEDIENINNPQNMNFSPTNNNSNNNNDNNSGELYAMYSKDENALIMNATVVPINEPAIPSLDKKPARGKTLRWVINVNCYYK